MPDNVDDLRRQLSDFLAHEVTPVGDILAQHSAERVFEEIESILRNGDPEAIAHALGFVRDASSYSHQFRDSFREHLARSTIWNALGDLLRSPVYLARRSAIHAIGKLCFKDRACLLSEAFPYYLDKDPINLPGLLFELRWLTSEWRWDFIEQAAAAAHYSFRWSLCEVLRHYEDSPSEGADRGLAILARLKCDSNSLVVAQATWLFERISVKLRPKLPKPEWRDEVRRIGALEPKLMFGPTAIQFMNPRWRSDYSLDEFDRFISGLVADARP